MSDRYFSLVSPRGFLLKEAQEQVEQTFGKEVDKLLDVAEDENQLRIVGSILQSIIGKKIADKKLPK